ncbi:TonB-dependent receptor [Asticcacaulis sp. BYS171W]|uniref:TonB-dependent receptor n=1 Tax=Asticcacaulis aquaticus TaxID=2984212 RepID=A0ABT5HZ31_9CAUL|nr:TonB-dependent receptor [Asticcacaulis aquaticus]MDC7685193.1 TonB-dependent receptor [Asticcacaulis aquaticus]
MRLGLRTHLLWSVAAVSVLTASFAVAETRRFDIPADNAALTLPEFARQAGLQIIAPTGRIKGVHTRAVQGDMDPRKALRHLLKGTGLEVAADTGTVISLRLKADETPVNRPPLTAAPVLAPIPAPVLTRDAAPQDIPEVIVIGARHAQRTAIELKRNAPTALDAIVADDVGSFPDRNVNEAVSRIAGVAISRNEYGEGADLNIRGSGSDLTRVEIDGMSVANSGFDVSISGNGRASDLRELPADLVKSIEVVKGQTPDITEGGLGGTVLIKTRTAMEFNKPYLSLRLAGERNSLSRRWVPDINIVATRKFFDDRVGILLNLTTTKRLNDSHQVAQGGANNNRGYIRLFDLDNSAEKTYTLNPALVSGVDRSNIAYDAPLQSLPLASGAGRFETLSALEIVTRSANARTKGECLSAFPLYTAAELDLIAPSTNNINRALAQEQRIREQRTCVAQWNDYLPNTINDRFKSNYEARLAWDLRLDVRVNDHLSLYGKYQSASRHVDEQVRTRARGAVQWDVADRRMATASLTGNTDIPVGSLNVLTAVPGSGYYIYNAGQPTGLVRLDSTLGGANVQNGFPYYGIPVNLVPGSVVVDANHYATQFQTTNSVLSYDNIRNDQVWENAYLLTGGRYRRGGLSIDFQASRSDSAYQRTDARFRRSAVFGVATVKATSGGWWTVELPAGFDPDRIDTLYPLNAAADAASPQYSSSVQLTYDPKLTESAESAVKADLTYRLTQGPLLRSVRFGVNRRRLVTRLWSGGGYQPSTGVSVPESRLRGTIRACENTATTTAANACVYGYVPATNGARYGVETVTRAQLLDIYRHSVQLNSGPFMPGIAGFEGAQLWNTVDVTAALGLMVGGVNFNLDCMKVCRGTDGQLYETPESRSIEDITAAYYRVDVERDLPLGLRLEGNFGVRAVTSEVKARGFVQINALTKAADWNAAEGYDRVTTTFVTRPVEIARRYTDWLPSYNASLWLRPGEVVLRHNWTRALARPPVTRLWPDGECTFDQRIADRIAAGETGLDMSCGTFGNPALKPLRGHRTNTALEWYPDKDAYLSLTYYRLKVETGAPVTAQLSNQPLFEGSDEVDPALGRRLSDYRFTYTTYVNGPSYAYSGWELSGKAALTGLPGRLRHTGVDVNIATNRAEGAASLIDPITGEDLGVQNRSDYFLNIAIWYDDGRTNARLAYQARDAVLRCLTGCGVSSDLTGYFPSSNPASTSYVALPYNPGEPYYTRAYAYLDAKITHRLTPNVDLYWEGRNLLRESSVLDNRDGEHPLTINYGGRRFTFGFQYRLN